MDYRYLSQLRMQTSLTCLGLQTMLTDPSTAGNPMDVHERTNTTSSMRMHGCTQCLIRMRKF